jgi:hypothetical protein
VLASLVLVAALGAPGGAAAAPKAWLEPTEVDLGLIEEGKMFERYVELKNVGDGVLVLEDLKTSCGCTAAAVDGVVELAAGQSQKIRLSFSSKNMDGSVRKTVTVTTNDPEQRHMEIALHADVHRAVRLTPKYLELNAVKSKDSWEQKVRVESDAPLDMKLKEVFVLGGKLRSEPSQLFDVDVAGPRLEGERNVHEVTVRLRTPAKPQKISEILVVATDRPAPDDTLRVMLRGEVVGRIRASTGFVVLRPVNPGEAAKQDITLSAEEGTFTVVGAEVPDTAIATKIFPSEGGKQTIVSVTYTGTEPGANGVASLKIRTDDPDQKLIEIPVRFQTRADTQAAGAAAPASTPPSTSPVQGK